MAALLSIENARTYQRYEDGENRADAHIVVRISDLTGCAVGATDMHDQRIDWLRENRPELFDEEDAATAGSVSDG